MHEGLFAGGLDTQAGLREPRCELISPTPGTGRHHSIRPSLSSLTSP